MSRKCFTPLTGPACPCRAWWLAVALLLTPLPGVPISSGADPVTPAAPTQPTTPAAPTSAPGAASGASPEAPALPGYGPGEGLPLGPLGPSDMPQMELIPNGMMPLAPGLEPPSQSLGQASPLVPQAVGPVDLKTLHYQVSKFTFKYGAPKKTPDRRLPAPEALAKTSVMLGETPTPPPGGLVGPGAGERDIPVVLAQIKTAETFSGDALQAIYTAIVAQINKRGVYGVFVVVDPDQINPSTGEDLRKGSTELTLLVYASEIRQVRTIVKPVAKWPFKAPSTSLDDPKYRRVTKDSPLQPPVKDKPGSLLQKAASYRTISTASTASPAGGWTWP